VESQEREKYDVSILVYGLVYSCTATGDLVAVAGGVVYNKIVEDCQTRKLFPMKISDKSTDNEGTARVDKLKVPC
jgi:hypothetical protein